MAESLAAQRVSMCNYCERKVVKSVKCANCETIFHKSCSARKICCNNQEIVNNPGNITFDEQEDEITNDSLLESLKVENNLLRELNVELRTNNQLLKEKIATLEGELNKQKSNLNTELEENSSLERNIETIKDIINKEVQTFFKSHNQNFIHGNTPTNNEKQHKKIYSSINSSKQQKTKESTAGMYIQKIDPTLPDNLNNQYKKHTQSQQQKYSEAVKNTHIDNTGRTQNKERMIMEQNTDLDKAIKRPQIQTHNSKKTNAENLEKLQRNKMYDLINLETDQNDNLNKSDEKQKFQEARAKRKRFRVGNGEGDEEFHGKNEKERKIWLFITKVPDDVNEGNIKKYIESRTNTNDVHVKKLVTHNTNPDNQSFMVGVQPHLQTTIYDAKFWPRKIAFDRFNFRRGRRFLDTPQNDADINVNTQPISFLAPVS